MSAGARVRRSAAAVTAALVLAGILPVVTASPAAALAIFCGSTFEGVDNDYAEGKSNGHPEDETVIPSSGLDGWAGLPALTDLKRASFALQQSDEILDSAIGIFDRGLDSLPSKLAQVVGVTVRALLHIAQQSVDTVVLSLEIQNADVNNCSSTLTTDFVDLLWTLVLEEDLAYLDLNGSTADEGSPARAGTRQVPAAMYLLPQDGWPAWHDSSSLYSDLPGHPNPDIYYVDGALNGDPIGLAVTVRNQIAYMEAAGMDTGETTTTTRPDGGQITTYGARDLWKQAMQLMATGDLRAAHVRLAQAYQTAVTQQPPPGVVLGGSGSPPPPNPWGP